MKGISVVIISLNEERNIGRCIDSVKNLADEVIILDSFSTDRTVEIALEKGALVKQHPFTGYIEQKNRGLQLASYDHVLSLDADEALSPGLSASILAEKNDLQPAYVMNRSNYFCGKFIRHGLWYPDRKLRLFDRRIAKWGGYDPHDKIILNTTVPVKRLQGDLLHYAYYTMAEYLHRNESIGMIAARSLFESGIKKHWSKVLLSPPWEFINGYFLRLGFMDGYRGLVIAVHAANQSYIKHQALQRLQKQRLAEMAWD